MSRQEEELRRFFAKRGEGSIIGGPVLRLSDLPARLRRRISTTRSGGRGASVEVLSIKQIGTRIQVVLQFRDDGRLAEPGRMTASSRLRCLILTRTGRSGP